MTNQPKNLSYFLSFFRIGGRMYQLTIMTLMLFYAAAGLTQQEQHQARYVDVYGATLSHQKFILDHYGQKIYDISTIPTRYIQTHPNYWKNPDQYDAMFQSVSKKNEALKSEIKNKLHLAYIDFDTIDYPDKKSYVTIEVIEQQDHERLRLLGTHTPQNYHMPVKKDLCDAMIEYNFKGSSLFSQQNKAIFLDDCPVYHCTFGFKHPDLKPYLERFNQGAIAERAAILKILKQDPIIERRMAAVMLVGHFKNPQEIIQILFPYVHDPDDGVRNNAMRVIGDTMRHSKYTDIDVRPFIRLLLSPYVTDRNKALLVLSQAAESPKQRKIILQLGRIYLEHLAQLKQPNNRNFAVSILGKTTRIGFTSNNMYN